MEKLSIRIKLIASFMALIIFLAVVTVVSYVNLKGLNKQSSEIAHVWMFGTQTLGEIQKNVITIRNASLILALSDGRVDNAKHSESFKNAKTDLHTLMEAYRNTIVTEEDRILFAKFEREVSEFEANYIGYDELLKAGNVAQLRVVLTKAEELYQPLTKSLDNLIDLNDRGSKASTEKAGSMANQSTIALIVTFVIALIIGVALLMMINRMMKALRQMVIEVDRSASSLAVSGEEISIGTNEVAASSVSQAESSNFAAEMMKEMAQAVQEVTENAQVAATLSESAHQKASIGDKAIHETLDGMRDIRTKIHDLESKSLQIGEIVNVIDEIAEQTNLLALNAAIEAARAGEAGKGFVVVADEVRKLAERSSKATKQISSLIQSIQENTKASVAAVQSGDEKANRAGSAFSEIINEVKETANRIIGIAASCEELSAQSAEVVTSVQTIANLTEQVSAAIEETAASSAELAKVAENLSAATSKLNI